MALLGRLPGRSPAAPGPEPRHDADTHAPDDGAARRLESKPFLQRALPVFACGAGLFSDGYLNNVIGSVNTVLKLQYGAVYENSEAGKHVSDIAFAGTVIGQLVFGFASDRWSRSNSLVLSTIILIVFTALTAGSYYRGEPVGMFNMLAAWRFFVGIGIGGRFPPRGRRGARALTAPQVNIPPAVLAAPSRAASSRPARAIGGSSSSPTA